jgi:tetratricopeptide (TPR) repeat protein
MNLLKCVAGALLVAAVACSKDPEIAKREFAASGDAYVQQKQYAEAIIQYRNALQQDPRYGEVRYKLADAYMQNGQSPEAAREYIRAADLLPEHVEAQLKAAQILLLAGRFPDAQARVDAVLKKNPDHLDAQLLKASALAGMKKLDEAVTQVEAAIEDAPDRSGTYIGLANLQLARGEQKAAEDAFKRAVAVAPQAVEPRLALANYYWLARRPQEAHAMLSEVYAANPKDARVNRTLAAFYLASGKRSDAEAHLKAAAEVANDDSSRMVLANFYLSINKRAEAEAILLPMSKSDSPAGTTAKVRLAGLAIVDGRRAEAYKLLDESLKKQPNHTPALLAKAELLFQDGKNEEALAAAKGASDTNSMTHFVMGRILFANGKRREAAVAFNETLRINPRSVGAQIQLARVHLSLGEVDPAVQMAQAATKAAPQNAAAQLMLARAYLAKRDTQSAESVLRPMMAAMPKSPDVHAQFGFLQLLKKNDAGARAAFERATVLNPTQQDALGALVALDIQAGKAGGARARVEHQLSEHPRDPGTLILAARTYWSMRDFPAAERTLRDLLRIDPSFLAAYGMLGQLYTAQQRLDDARAEFEALAFKSPQSVAAPTFVAMIHQAQNRNDDAKTWYEKALAIDGNAPVPANNLAWLMAETGGNLDVALQLAQTAKKGLPDAAEVDDTLGWIYYKKGLTPLAIQSFTISVEKDPKNATYHYHLGLAYVGNHESERARKALEQALSLKPSAEEAAAVQKALAGLKG